MQMATKKQTEQYGNSSISMLKGEDRVRKRPAVIFGSDDLEGCKHAVFEILSNAIDEAREGHGDTIIVTRYEDLSERYRCRQCVYVGLFRIQRQTDDQRCKRHRTNAGN